MEVAMENVCKRYGLGREALHKIDLQVSDGILGLLGPNGSGKTTLLRILATRIRATSGKVYVGPYDLAQPSGLQKVRAQLGYVPQELLLYPAFSGREFLDYMGLLKGIRDRSAREQMTITCLEEVGLTEMADAKIMTYSDGVKRRLCIAQALLGHPRLLIIDELTTGLDPEEQIYLQLLLLRLTRVCLIIFSTHRVEDILRTCQHFAILDQGMLVFEGRTNDLLAVTACHAVAEGYTKLLHNHQTAYKKEIYNNE